MKRTLSCLLILLSLITIACGEDEKKSSSDASSGDTSGSTSSSDATSEDTSGSTSSSDDTSGSTSGTEDVTGEDTSGSTSGTEDTSGSTSGDVDLCQNTPDLDYLVASISGGKHDGKTGREAASDAASTCGLANIAADDPKTATIECMQAEPENIGLTDGCTGCYGDIVLCTIENCISKCAVDPSSTPCTDCQEEKGCVAAFNACTGPLP